MLKTHPSFILQIFRFYMVLKYNSRQLQIIGLLLSILVWLANSGNPPTGRTGAPFDGHCNNCHGGSNPGNFNGTVEVSGMPGTVEANTTYPLVITLTPTGGSPVRGGFQLVAVDGNNANAGDLTPGNAQSGTEFFSGREYVEHRGAKNFTGGGPASWNFNWKSPVTAAGNTIKFYMIGNFTNGNNNDSGDFPIAALETYNFNGPPPLTTFISNTQNVSCFGGNDGSATVEASGGLAPYTYAWSNGQNSSTAVNLTAGTYTVTVTGSSGTGTATATAVITQPPVLNTSASVNGILTCTNTSVTATATASGGVGGYTFNWSNGGTGSSTQLTAPGLYMVTATDGNGCTKTANVNVSSNTIPPNAEAGPTGTLTCTQPTVTLSGSGSSGPTFTYLWTASNGGNIVSNANTLTPTVNAAGTYTLVVTNTNNGCTASDATTVVNGAQPPTASATGGELTCVINNVTLNATTNATMPGFSWTGPNGFSSTLQAPSVSVAGVYTVTITDGSTGCTNTATASVTANTTAPTASATGGTLTCSSPSVTLMASSNATGATFAWTGPNNFTSTQQNPTANVAGVYTVVVTNPANGCTASATATATGNTTPPTGSVTAETITCADPLATLATTTNANPATFAWSGPGGFSSTLQNPEVSTPGTYTVTITNSGNGCTTTVATTVNQNITAPTSSIATPGNLNCLVTSLQLNGSASSQGPNFAYLWSTSNGNITSGGNTLTPTVNAPGTYTLVVTNNANGCTSSASVTVAQSPPVSTTISNVVNISCNGGSNGSATAAGSGGSGMGYTYLWSNGATTPTANGLTAGTYSVTVSDSENCTSTASITIVQPPVLNANAVATAETALGANDGTATASPTGGTPGYTYLWNNSSTTQTITGLAPGNYTVTVADANGCTAVQTVTVNSFNCNLSATASVTNVSCFGAGNGSATVTVSGATNPVTYSWSNGGTTNTISNLSPGMYTVNVVDANNCPYQLTVQITGPAQLAANATATNQTGVGQNDGTATAAPTGGTPGYTYLWSNSSTTQTITGLAPGAYTVTVTDNNGCTAVQTVQVNAFNCNLGSTISATNVSCPETNDGQATAVASGGTLPFQYSWSNGDNMATTTSLGTGTYTVTITDDAGCQSSATVTIVSGDVTPPQIDCPGSPVLSCPNAVLEYSLPTVSDNCNLNGAQAELISGLPSGSTFPVGETVQLFQVEDASGNTSTCSFSVLVSPAISIVLDGTTPDVNNAGVGTIDVTVSGGAGNLTYSWEKDGQPYANTEDLANLTAGEYTLVVSDENGCTITLGPVTIDNTVSTGEPGDATLLRILPNPVRGSFRLEIEGVKPGAMQILDCHGRLIRTLIPAEWNSEVDAGTIPSGIYYLRVLDDRGGAIMVKWIKMD